MSDNHHTEENTVSIKWIWLCLYLCLAILTVACVVAGIVNTSRAAPTYSSISTIQTDSTYSSSHPAITIYSGGEYWGSKGNGQDLFAFTDPVEISLSYGVWIVSGTQADIATILSSRTAEGSANTIMYDNTSITFNAEDVSLFALNNASLGTIKFTKIMAGSPSGLASGGNSLSYQQGADEANAYWSQKYDALQADYNALLQSNDISQDAINQAFNNGVASSDIVTNVIGETVDGIGSVIGQIFSFRVFGIPIMSILLAVVLVGICILILRLFL